MLGKVFLFKALKLSSFAQLGLKWPPEITGCSLRKEKQPQNFASRGLQGPNVAVAAWHSSSFNSGAAVQLRACGRDVAGGEADFSL